MSLNNLSVNLVCEFLHQGKKIGRINNLLSLSKWFVIHKETVIWLWAFTQNYFIILKMYNMNINLHFLNKHYKLSSK